MVKLQWTEDGAMAMSSVKGKAEVVVVVGGGGRRGGGNEDNRVAGGSVLRRRESSQFRRIATWLGRETQPGAAIAARGETKAVWTPNWTEFSDLTLDKLFNSSGPQFPQL